MKTTLSMLLALALSGASAFASTDRVLDGKTVTSGAAVVTLPTTTQTLCGITQTCTLTNKTLTAPVIATIVNTGTLTLPTSTDTLVGRATTDTMTNKTLTSPSITTPTGIVKGDVGLGNVDNTSDSTKNSASVTLTNKSLGSDLNPTSTNSVALGSSSLAYSSISAAVSNFIDTSGNSIRASISAVASQTMPSTNSVNVGFSSTGSDLIGIWTANNATADANATAALRLETGNKTAGTGNSGNIIARTGTSSGGVRGDFQVSANSLQIRGGGTFAQSLRFFDNDSSNFVAFHAPDPITTNVTWTLPATDGTSGYCLSTNGSGILSWSACSGGSGANQFLSNLTSPTAINQDLIFDTGSAAILKTKDSASTTTKDLNLVSGNASGTNASGAVYVVSGTADNGTGNVGFGSGNTSAANVNSGLTSIFSGAATGTGASGGISMVSGTTVDQQSGAANFGSGIASGTGFSGQANLYSGDGSGTGGSGSVSIFSGQGIAGTGGVALYSGTTSAADVNSGTADMYSGGASGTGSSGTVSVRSGAAVNGNSGDITIASATPSGSGSRGILYLAGDHIDASGNKIIDVTPGGNGQGNAVVTKDYTDMFVYSSPGSPAGIVAGTGVEYSQRQTRETWFIVGSGGPVVVTANPQIVDETAGDYLLQVGDELRLIGTNNINTVTFSDGNGLSLNGSWVGADHSVLNLMWDGSVWVETSRR